MHENKATRETRVVIERCERNESVIADSNSGARAFYLWRFPLTRVLLTGTRINADLTSVETLLAKGDVVVGPPGSLFLRGEAHK